MRRCRCTARELAENPVAGYLLTGVTIDARPCSVEVFGGAFSHRLHECVSFGRCRRWKGSDLRFAHAGRDRTQRSNVSPSAQRTCGSRRHSVGSTHDCRTPASSPQCARTAAEENGVGAPGATAERLASRTRRAGRRLSRRRPGTGFWLLTPCWRGPGALLNPLDEQLFGCRRLRTTVRRNGPRPA